MVQKKVTLVIQSFGRENEYKRAVFTILSLFAYRPVQERNTTVIVFTDNPAFFHKNLAGLPVRCISLTAEKIAEMRGKIDFLHRMKIAVIEQAFEGLEGSMLYADSDTFFTADPSPLLTKLSPRQCFMHLWEYRFEEMRNWPLPAGKTFRDFLKLIETATFTLANGNTITVSPKQVSWNAGVMMFDSSHVRFIPDVYALTEQFYPPTQNHASEQYAFSIILQNNIEVAPCDDVVYHYWYRVEKKIVDLFLAERMTEQWQSSPIEEKLQQVTSWCTTLPGLFKQHILTLQDKAIQSFNSKKYWKAYPQALRAILKKPNDAVFVRNVLYHTKKGLIG